MMRLWRTTWMLVGDVPWRMFIGSVKRHWSHLHSCVEVKEWSIGVTCLSCTPLYSHIIMSRTGADLALPPRIVCCFVLPLLM
ncbi:hypothetical protein F2Q70_00019658 [Brassica cretica]|nr:hypothetical protein F2Q70_00019658 [Brassica cretica]